MKIRIELDDACQEEEVIIRCRTLSDDTRALWEKLVTISRMQEEISFYKETKQYFVKLSDVLFFETDGREVHAHTANDVYCAPYRLYELEELLPPNFLRISKSTILNLHQVYAMDRTLSAACTISFANTHKQVYVSRRYYPALRHRLEERRLSI